MALAVEQQEEQLRDLQRRYCTMEAEHHANVKAMQRNMQANSSSLLQLKAENADLLQHLKDLKSQRVLPAPQHIERKNEEVARLRTQLDRQRNQNAKHRQRLDQMQDKLKERTAGHVGGTMGHSLGLSGALIELNEAYSVRATYEQIARRLKKERIGLYKHLEALEENLKEKKQEQENLLGVCHDAAHANELAQAELHRLSKALESDRQKRGAEVKEKHTVIRQWLQSGKRMREAACQEAAARSAIAATSSAAGSLLPLESPRDSAEAEAYEDALRRLKEATGVSDANDIIEHFLSQNHIYQQLLAFAQRVEERRFASLSSGIVLGGGPPPEVAEAKLTAAKQLLQSQQQAHYRTQHLLSELQTGVIPLIKKLARAKEQVDFMAEPDALFLPLPLPFRIHEATPTAVAPAVRYRRSRTLTCVSAVPQFQWLPSLEEGAPLCELFSFCCTATRALVEATKASEDRAATEDTPSMESGNQQKEPEASCREKSADNAAAAATDTIAAVAPADGVLAVEPEEEQATLRPEPAAQEAPGCALAKQDDRGEKVLP
ncbi:axonemal dynein intermediate chain related protein [Cyclospora cayetanensis]|uniref:Axonemal dynein intermediate chain related protein n=1 Tax=Cyclospora cayetanensis TaxID=88456 RepID=A0A1D3D818_9EIME|nr:axonemal dynein intermediate chain related protein [Cyclospora cayetanensis]